MDRQTDEHDQIINFVANVVDYQNIISNRCTVQSGTMEMRQLLQYSYYSLYPQIWNQIKSNQVYGQKRLRGHKSKKKFRDIYLYYDTYSTKVPAQCY